LDLREGRRGFELSRKRGFSKNRLDGVIEFKKGNDEFLLSSKQAGQLCWELADSAGSLGAGSGVFVTSAWIEVSRLLVSSTDF
jgi:hypothetical protein